MKSLLSLLRLLRRRPGRRAGQHRGTEAGVPASAGRCAHHGALVVVRSFGYQARTGARDARHEGGRHRRIRSPADLSARSRGQLPVSLRRVPGVPALRRREGPGTGPAHGSHAGQRLAVRRSAHPDRPGVGKAARGARTAGAGPRPRARSSSPRSDAERDHPVFHRQPHAADGEAAGRGRRRLRAGSLRPRRHPEPSQNGRRAHAARAVEDSAVRHLQRQPGSVQRRLDRQFPRRVSQAPRLRPHAAPARAGRASGTRSAPFATIGERR